MREINISDIPKEEAIIFKSYIPTMFKYFAPLGTLPISFFICFLIIKPEWAIPMFILGVLPFLALIVFFCINAAKKTMAFVGDQMIFLADDGNYYSISNDELLKYHFQQNKMSMHRYYSKLFIRNLPSGKVILRLRKNIFSIKCNSLYKAEACLRSFVNGENISAKDFCYEKPAHINWEKITLTIEIILTIFICTLFATVDLILPHFKYDKVDGDMVIFVGLIPVIIFSIILLFIPSSQSIEDREYKRKNSDDSDGELIEYQDDDDGHIYDSDYTDEDEYMYDNNHKDGTKEDF